MHFSMLRGAGHALSSNIGEISLGRTRPAGTVRSSTVQAQRESPRDSHFGHALAPLNHGYALVSAQSLLAPSVVTDLQ